MQLMLNFRVGNVKTRATNAKTPMMKAAGYNTSRYDTKGKRCPRVRASIVYCKVFIAYAVESDSRLTHKKHSAFTIRNLRCSAYIDEIHICRLDFH